MNGRELKIGTCGFTPHPKAHITPKYLHGSTFGKFLCPRKCDLEDKLDLAKIESKLGLQIPTIFLNKK